MSIDLTAEEWQTVIDGLGELPAKISYSLIVKILQAQQRLAADTE